MACHAFPTHCLALLALIIATLVNHVSAAAPGTCLSGAMPFVISSDCAPGFYCPNFNSSDSATFPVVCSPTIGCSVTRLKGDFCEAQGTYEPMLCKAGYYCPTSTLQLECPEGNFCPAGSVFPRSCPPMSICGAGSDVPLSYASAIAVVIADVVLAVLVFLYRLWHRRRLDALHNASAYAAGPGATGGATGGQGGTNPSKQLQQQQPSAYDGGSISPSPSVDSLPAHILSLCSGFRSAQQSLPPVLLEFNNLSLRIPANTKEGTEAKTILAGVTGSVRPGCVTAIMGPSGAGTFLSTMLGKVDPSWQRAGTLHINGQEHELTKFRKLVGYVMQEDVMHRDLSVYENIRFAAQTRLPASWTDKQVEEHVNAVIVALQLTHVQDSTIGDETTRGVSGGQRKRCNIGMELAAAPSLLLLDEPTSGLDSTSAMDVCTVLKELARAAQLTVAMVIHQPRVEIWRSLDELLLLAPGGRTVFQGPARFAVLYFERTDPEGFRMSPGDNPADALMDRLAEKGEFFTKKWSEGGRDRLQQIKKEAAAKEDAAAGTATGAWAAGAITVKEAAAVPLPHSPYLSPNLSSRAAGGGGGAGDNSSIRPSSGALIPISLAVPALEVQQQHQLSSGQSHGGGSRPPTAGNSNGNGHSNGNSNSTNGLHGNVAAAPHMTPRSRNTTITTTSGVGGDHVKIQVQPRPSRPAVAAVTAVEMAELGGGGGGGGDDAAGADGPKKSLGNYPASYASMPPFPSSGELRLTAPFLRQVRLNFARSARKQLLNFQGLMLETVVGVLAGIIMGIAGGATYQGILVAPYTPISPSPDETTVTQIGMFVAMGISLAAASAGVRVFGEEQIIYWRESAAGHNKYAYYLGNSLAQLPRNFISGLHFAFVYHILAAPILSFHHFLPIAFLLFYSVYGLGALVSMLVARTNAPLVSVVVALILSVFNGYVRQIPLALKVLSGSYFATEAMFDKSTEPYRHVMQVADISSEIWGYQLGWYAKDLGLIVVVGTVYRILALAAMVGTNRAKQR